VQRISSLTSAQLEIPPAGILTFWPQLVACVAHFTPRDDAAEKDDQDDEYVKKIVSAGADIEVGEPPAAPSLCSS
jgi:hypothetical protein